MIVFSKIMHVSHKAVYDNFLLTPPPPPLSGGNTGMEAFLHHLAQLHQLKQDAGRRKEDWEGTLL